MEKVDLELIEQLTDKDPELKRFWDEHLSWNSWWTNSTAALSHRGRDHGAQAAAEIEAGRPDKMEQILARYRRKEKSL